jgi:hypothetical protein
MESAAGAIIIFQGSMRTSAQNTKVCIGQNAGCIYSSSFHRNAWQAKVFHFQQLIVPDFGFTPTSPLEEPVRQSAPILL